MAAEVDLFVYGTLMNESRLSSLTRYHFVRQEAELSGFERSVLPTGYAYILPKAGARIQGFLLSGINPISLAILDRYEEEGNPYHRRQVEITVGGRRVSCETCVRKVEALKAYSSLDTLEHELPEKNVELRVT